MIVDKKLNFENQYVPYKFDVEVVTDGFCIDDLLCDLKRLIKFDIGVGKIEFRKAYFLDSSLTYLEKVSESYVLNNYSKVIIFNFILVYY